VQAEQATRIVAARMRPLCCRTPVPGKSEVWSIVSRSPKHLALQALVVAAMVVGITSFVSFDKAIALTVDGETKTVHTFASTVEGVLAREGIEIGAHDTVVPAPGSAIREGQRVAVRFGRLLTLTQDGKKRQVWVTAMSVQEALEQLGLRADGAYLSASRSMPIGRQGLALTVRTPRGVTIVADGKKRKLTTTAGTVQDALTQAGIKPGAIDEVKPAVKAFPANGATITVTRVAKKRVTADVEIPMPVEKIKDSSLYEGERDIETKGADGLKQITYDVVTRNGKVAKKKVVGEKVLRQPKKQVVRVGTKERERSYGGTGVENLNWPALADCESGGNPKAYNPAGPYYGLYQFSGPTWRSVGGSGVASDASPSEQTYRAQLLYKKAGAGQWPVCGKYLFS
jgi:uncharacterized protein YabE (DUF348 family)